MYKVYCVLSIFFILLIIFNLQKYKNNRYQTGKSKKMINKSHRIRAGERRNHLRSGVVSSAAMIAMAAKTGTASLSVSRKLLKNPCAK